MSHNIADQSGNIILTSHMSKIIDDIKNRKFEVRSSDILFFGFSFGEPFSGSVDVSSMFSGVVSLMQVPSFLSAMRVFTRFQAYFPAGRARCTFSCA